MALIKTLREFSARTLAIGTASLLISSIFVLAVKSSVAQRDQRGSTFVYTVKFVCDIQEIGDRVGNGDNVDFKKTTKDTVININNSNPKRASFTWRVVLPQILPRPAEPGFPGRVSNRVSQTLDPGRGLPSDQNAALTLGCFDILKQVGALEGEPLGRPSNDGLVVIESSDELDVVAVYTFEIEHRKQVRRGHFDERNKFIFVFRAEDETVPGDIPLNQLQEVIVPGAPGKVVDPADAVRDKVNEIRRAEGNPPLPKEVQVEVMSVEYGVGEADSLGVGTGSGTSIDVEHIQPRVIEE